jgi:predicted Zn-dependent protease
VWPNWDWELGEKEFLKALELDPNDALCRIYFAHLLMILHRFNEATYQANMALALDPLRPLVLGLYGRVMIWDQDYNAAMIQSKKALAIDPDNNFALGGLADAYLATGDTLNWYENEKKRYYWTTEEYLASLDSVFLEGGYLAVIRDRIRVNEEVLSKGGAISYYGQALRYLEVKNYDKALDFFDKAYDEQIGNLAYVSLLVIQYPEMKNNLRYTALLKKMNLPLK